MFLFVIKKFLKLFFSEIVHEWIDSLYILFYKINYRKHTQPMFILLTIPIHKSHKMFFKKTILNLNNSISVV